MRTATGLLAVFLFTIFTPVGLRAGYDSAAPIAYMIDTNSGTVLYDKNSNRKFAPASMTKMMTAYVAFDLISKGKLKPQQKLTVRPETWKAWNNAGSTMFLKPNEQVRVVDLLHGIITLSANDAAIVLAEGIAGSKNAFVDRMNTTALHLGMKHSRFGTPNGWPDGGCTFTTARDLALLSSRTIHDFPLLYRQFYGQPTFRWNNITQRNRNPILGRIAGADGLKTGHTTQAGYCLTGTAERNDRRLIMIVAGLDSDGFRTSESVRFMRWGFDAWRIQPLFGTLQTVAKIPVQLGSENWITIVAPHKLALALPVGDNRRYKLSVRYTGPIKAPVEKGAEVAQLIAKFSDGTERTMPLVASNSVNRVGFFGRAWSGLKYLIGA